MSSYGSPYQDHQRHSQPPQHPPSGGEVTPGTITYTTSTGPDGRVVYHQFKAVPATYQTPNGVVSGIQWVPAEATQVLPSGAQPANADFAASWRGGYLSKDDEKALKDWQKDEAKRAKKEEKAAKRLKERREREKAEDKDPYRVQGSLGHKKSFNQGPVGGGYPSSAGAGIYGNPNQPPGPIGGGIYDGGGSRYPDTGYSRDRKVSTNASDLDRRFGDIDLQGRDREHERESKNRPRQYAGNADPNSRASGNFGPPSPYSTSQATSPVTHSAHGGGYPPYPPPSGAGGQAYPSSPNMRPVSPNPRPAYPSSPNMRPVSPNPRQAYPSSPNMRPVSPNPPPAASGYPASSGYPTSASGYPASPRAGYAAPGGAPPGAYPTSPSGYPTSAGGYNVPTGPSGYPSSGYPSSPSRGHEPIARSTTPFGGATHYPKGHIMEGQPINRSGVSPQPGSAPFPSGGAYPPASGPGMGRSPNMAPMPLAQTGDQQLSTPEGFSRPVNQAQPYTPFDPMKIQDMDEFLEQIPRMPLVLQPHDVYHEDWIRMMQDLSLAWADALPVPDISRSSRPPKRSTLARDLIDLWNSRFFLNRGVEVVLYKGAERRSGPQAGKVDIDLSNYDDDSSSDTSSSSSESEESGGERYGQGQYGVYGRQGSGGLPSEVINARRQRRENKVEKKRRAKEKRQRKKQKEREKKYALYLTCVPLGGAPSGYPQGPGLLGVSY